MDARSCPAWEKNVKLLLYFFRLYEDVEKQPITDSVLWYTSIIINRKS